ncbi:hypothetical protein C7S18_16995 [Ahniella affigens]|uniref:Uncharacterized protein n=1 Tax=Ahniella affigens TaxID=2021234 RepID=A0A2P1PVA2_9GAMM|nr:hypothetical protein C7S18_16995 [Ahniella affigens]
MRRGARLLSQTDLITSEIEVRRFANQLSPRRNCVTSDDQTRSQSQPYPAMSASLSGRSVQAECAVTNPC